MISRALESDSVRYKLVISIRCFVDDLCSCNSFLLIVNNVKDFQPKWQKSHETYCKLPHYCRGCAIYTSTTLITLSERSRTFKPDIPANASKSMRLIALLFRYSLQRRSCLG